MFMVGFTEQGDHLMQESLAHPIGVIAEIRIKGMDQGISLGLKDQPTAIVLKK